MSTVSAKARELAAEIYDNGGAHPDETREGFIEVTAALVDASLAKLIKTAREHADVCVTVNCELDRELAPWEPSE